MSSTPRLKDDWKNYIAGEWCDGGAGRLTIDNPGTGKSIAEHALTDNADVDRAVAAARACHESGALSSMRPVERGRIVCMVWSAVCKKDRAQSGADMTTRHPFDPGTELRARWARTSAADYFGVHCLATQPCQLR